MATQYDPIAKDESLNTTETPSRNVADVLAEELQNIASAIGGGGGSGHAIEGADGTALSQEPTLQFADADATDDAVNEKTVVNVVRKRTQAQYDAMSAADKAKGVIEINDANAKPLDASQVRYGSGTVKDELDGLSGSCTLQSDASGASPETAEYSINGNIGFIWGYFTCHNSTFEAITISDIPDGYLMPQSAIASRCYNTGELILIWVNDLIISTWNHTGSLVVGNKYYFSVPIIKS